MKIEPLSRRIYDRCKAEGVKTITLNFSGGSDEGYLDVQCNPSNGMEDEIEDWAWGAYSYSGAGDGTDYGDDIEYNLEQGTASHKCWEHQPSYSDSGITKFGISDDDEE